MKVYKGFTASPGLVLGQVSRLDRPPLVFGEGPFHPEQEKQALEDAIKVAQQELDEMAGRAAPSEQAIFLFQSMMLEDEGFMNEVAFQIKAGVGAAEAMDRVGHRYAAQLAAMKDNAYMQLRSVDILDVTQRITNILCHRIRSWLALDHPVILASDLLMPTDLFSVPAGRILVDGTGVGDVGSVVLRDRKHLAQDGMIVVCVNLSSEDGSVLSGPDIISRGFVYMKDNEDLMDAMKMIATHSLEVCHNRNISDWATIKSTIKGDLSQFLFKNTKRNPMILPVIMEI